jgi:hypothetical protein
MTNRGASCKIRRITVHPSVSKARKKQSVIPSYSCIVKVIIDALREKPELVKPFVKAQEENYGTKTHEAGRFSTVYLPNNVEDAFDSLKIRDMDFETFMGFSLWLWANQDAIPAPLSKIFA